ncbi:MAG: NfeD family protein [Planctomycetota bacterium]|jgi:membrane-bound ClpP family serine protease
MMLIIAQDAAASSDSYLFWAFALLAAAIVLLFVELLVPSGGLLAMLCGAAAIGSLVAFFMYDPMWGAIATAAYVILGPIALIFLFKLWLNSPLGRRMILGGETGEALESGDEAYAASEQARIERLADLQALIGSDGVTETDLRPVGTVKIGGRRVDALAESGVIAADTRVIVTDVYDNQIKVRPM